MTTATTGIIGAGLAGRLATQEQLSAYARQCSPLGAPADWPRFPILRGQYEKLRDAMREREEAEAAASADPSLLEKAIALGGAENAIREQVRTLRESALNDWLAAQFAQANRAELVKQARGEIPETPAHFKPKFVSEYRTVTHGDGTRTRELETLKIERNRPKAKNPLFEDKGPQNIGYVVGWTSDRETGWHIVPTIATNVRRESTAFGRALASLSGRAASAIVRRTPRDVSDKFNDIAEAFRFGFLASLASGGLSDAALTAEIERQKEAGPFERWRDEQAKRAENERWIFASVYGSPDRKPHESPFCRYVPVLDRKGNPKLTVEGEQLPEPGKTKQANGVRVRRLKKEKTRHVFAGAWKVAYTVPELRPHVLNGLQEADKELRRMSHESLDAVSYSAAADAEAICAAEEIAAELANEEIRECDTVDKFETLRREAIGNAIEMAQKVFASGGSRKSRNVMVKTISRGLEYQLTALLPGSTFRFRDTVRQGPAPAQIDAFREETRGGKPETRDRVLRRFARLADLLGVALTFNPGPGADANAKPRRPLPFHVNESAGPDRMSDAAVRLWCNLHGVRSPLAP